MNIAKYKFINITKLDDIISLKFAKAKADYNSYKIIIEELNEALDIIHNDCNVRVLTIYDLSNFLTPLDYFCSIQEMNYDLANILALSLKNCFEKIKNLNIPVIAVLDACISGCGLALAMYCDMRFATKNAKIKFSDIDLQLVPVAGISTLITKYINNADAAYYLFTGQQIPLNYCKDKGIIQDIIEDASIDNYVFNLTNILKSKDKKVLGILKNIIWNSYYNNINENIIVELQEFSSLLNRMKSRN